MGEKSLTAAMRLSMKPGQIALTPMSWAAVLVCRPRFDIPLSLALKPAISAYLIGIAGGVPAKP